MASNSLVGSLIDTVSSAASNLTPQHVEQFTGQRLDTVEQFMTKTSRTGPRNFGRGFVAGVIGGIVAVGVKMIVDHYAAPDVEQVEDRLADDMVNAAEGYAGVDLTEQQENAAEAILEVGMGALIGGVYGLVVEALPAAEHDQSESSNLLQTAKGLAGPALGLAPKAIKSLNHKHVESLAGNAAFGATLEVVRRTARYYMEEQ